MILPETVLYDLRYGARMLSRNTASAVVTVIALAIGIATNTAVFTAYKAIVGRPIEARHPSEWSTSHSTRDSGATDFTFSYPDYEAYRDSARSLSGLIAYQFAHVTLSNAGSMVSQRASTAASGFGKLALLPSGSTHAEFASVAVVSENYFQVLGVSPCMATPLNR